MKRIISALIIGPCVFLAILYAGPKLFLAGSTVVGLACLVEFSRLIRAMKLSNLPAFTYLAFLFIIVALERNLPAPAILAFVIMTGLLTALWRPGELKERLLGLMADLFGTVYISFLLYPAYLIRFTTGQPNGLHWLILIVVVVWTGDSAALAGGKMFGKHPFAPKISPKKTNEGAVAGLSAGIVAAFLLQHFFFTQLPLPHVLAVALLAGALGQLGDLVESMLKRAAGVKDSSHIIPGHGGVLDRIDSLLFAFPAAYLYLLIFHG